MAERDLEIEIQDDDEALVMDLYFPNIIKGNDADAIGSQELLDKLKEVDGHGSGLDADTLDGKHASEFLTGFDFPVGRVVVGGVDGGPADGGTYEEFVAAFNGQLSVL